MPTVLGAALLGSGLLSATLAAALWTATNNPDANRRLSLVLLVLAGMTSVYSLGWTGRVDVPATVAFMPFNLPLALGPLLFGYISTLATGRGLSRPLLHIIPAAVHFLYLCAAISLPEGARAAWKDGPHDDVVKPLLEAATLASLTSYTFAGLGLLGRYRRWLEHERSDADRYAGRWLTRVLIALLATLVALTLVRLYTWFVAELETGLLYVWFGIWATWLGVEGWRYTERRFPVMPASPAPAAEPSIAPVEVHDAVPVAVPDAAAGPDWSEIGVRWRSQTQAAGWWREQDLSLSDLAARLGTNTAYLSRAVNEGLGMNFNEMINRMRAAEAARLIDGDAQASLMQIAFDAGFSSKATFNRVFRTVHGTSPSEYRRLGSQISQRARESEASGRLEPGENGA